MYRAVKYLSVLLMALAPVCAHATICENVLSTEEAAPENVQRENPLTIPDDLNEIVSTDQLLLSVNTLTGKSYCYDASWVQSIENMELFEDGRFLGFHFYALEADGYILIDRVGDGKELATGNKPYFTDDGTRFVSLQMSGAGWGNLEGIAAWQITANDTKRIYFNEVERSADAHSIVKFHGSGCGLIETKQRKSGWLSASYISFEITDTLEFANSNALEKCIAKKTGKSVEAIRSERSANDTSPMEWHAIFDGADPVDSGRPFNMYFADKGSIFGSGDYLSIATSKLSILEKADLPNGMAITEYRSRYLVDCDSLNYKKLDAVKYNHIADKIEWAKASSGTSQMAIVAFACGTDSNVSEQLWQGNIEPRQWLEAMAQADWSN